jgi:hypothetical protein
MVIIYFLPVTQVYGNYILKISQTFRNIEHEGKAKVILMDSIQNMFDEVHDDILM